MAVPYIIGIAGPSGSGKSTIAHKVADALGAQIFSIDSYYHGLSHLTYEERCKTNFDHPDSIDSKLLSEHLHALARGETIVRPVYDFSRHTRAQETERVIPGDYLIVEGIFALVWDHVRELYGTKVFVEAGHKLCLGRRIKRDIEERGRTEESVLQQYEATVRGMMDLYINPTKAHADLVLSGDSAVAENAAKILEHVRTHHAPLAKS
jgi:uridine kinase